MNCAQLSKDLESLKASRDAMQKCFDSAEETRRGGVALKEVVNNYGALSDDILSEYLDDFERQYPGKWIRGFREIENIDWEDGGKRRERFCSTAELVDEMRLHCNYTLQNDLSDKSLIDIGLGLSDPNGHDIVDRVIHVKNNIEAPIYDYNIYMMNGGSEIITITNYFSSEEENTIQCFKNDNGEIIYDEEATAGIQVSDPYSLVRLDDQTIAVGCKDGQIDMMVKKEDDSWAWADSIRWEGVSISTMFCMVGGDRNIGLFGDHGQCAILHTANDPWVLKECLHKFTRKEDE